MTLSFAEIGGAFGGEKATGGGRESGSDAWKQYNIFISSVGLNATNNTVKVLFCLSFYSMYLMLGDLFLCKYFSILLPFLFCRNFDRRKTIDAKILYLK